MILGLLFEELVYPKSAMAVAPIAILVYATATPGFVRRCQLIVPAAVDGAIVGLGIGGATGFLFMLMAASLDPDRLRVTDHLRLMEPVQGVWLPTAIGTAASCGVVGVTCSLLRGAATISEQDARKSCVFFPFFRLSDRRDDACDVYLRRYWDGDSWRSGPILA